MDYNGATTDSEAVSIRVERRELLVAPNPTQKNIQTFVYNAESNSQVALIDASGKILWSTAVNSSKVEIPLQELSLRSGMYFLRNTTNNTSETRKLILQ